MTNRIFLFHLITLFSLAVVVSVYGQDSEPIDLFRDESGSIDAADLIRLSRYWRGDRWLFDLNGDAQIGASDLLRLGSYWHRSVPPDNRYSEGRAVGIHAVVDHDGRSFESGEWEFAIEDGLDGSSVHSTITSLNLLTPPFRNRPTITAKTIQSPRPSRRAMAEYFNRKVSELRRIPDDQPHVYPRAIDHRYGHESSQIGTFGGMSLWLGWSGSASDQGDPGSETFSWVIYFAPDGMFEALQLSQSTYAFVDVHKTLNTFFGVLESSDGDVLRRSTVSDLLGVSVLFDLGILDCGPTFFHSSWDSTLSRAIQFNFGKSVAPALTPTFVPLNAATGEFSQLVAGFYPLVLWDIDESRLDNPISAIVDQLETVMRTESDSVDAALAKEIARQVLPFMTFLRTRRDTTLKNNRTADTFADYIGDFLRRNSVSIGSSPNSSIDHLIGVADNLLQQGDAGALGTGLQATLAQYLPQPLSLYDAMKTIRASAQAGFELGEVYGFLAAVEEGLQENDTVFAGSIQTLSCRMGEQCRIEVTAEEIAALIPGSNPADFNGVEIVFDAMVPGDEEKTVTLRSGSAVHAFYPLSFDTMVFGIRVLPSAMTLNKTLELSRRVVTVESQLPQNVYLYGADRVQAGAPLTFNVSLVDIYGIPFAETSSIRFYDYLDRAVGESVEAVDGIANVRWIPRPSIPRIEGMVTSLIGYTQEEAHTGYIVSGSGFSQNASVFVNGVNVAEMEGWTWQVSSSNEVLVLPPDDEHLLTGTSQIRIVNPASIAGEPFEYRP